MLAAQLEKMRRSGASSPSWVEPHTQRRSEAEMQRFPKRASSVSGTAHRQRVELGIAVTCTRSLARPTGARARLPRRRGIIICEWLQQIAR